MVEVNSEGFENQKKIVRKQDGSITYREILKICLELRELLHRVRLGGDD